MPTLNNQVIIVLGMHRSGTSALTRVLNLHGMELGSHLMVPTKDNEVGYWEHQFIVDIHDEILKTLDSTWHNEILIDQWWLKESFQTYRERIKEILLRDFSKCPLWGIKDPRMCRLLPFWLSLLEELNCKPVFVLAIRHPLETAKSIEKRDGFSLLKGQRLWLQHSLLMEQFTRGLPRTIVFYEQLLSDWKNVILRVQSGLNNLWPKTPIDGEVDQFLNPTLRHHKASAESPDLSAWILQVYEAFAKGSMGNEEAMTKDLDSLYPAYEAMRLFQEDLHAELQTLQSRSSSQLQTAQASNRQLNSELQAVQAYMTQLKDQIGARDAKIHSLEQTLNWQSGVIESAKRWQGRSWFKRAFHKWRAPNP